METKNNHQTEPSKNLNKSSKAKGILFVTGTVAVIALTFLITYSFHNRKSYLYNQKQNNSHNPRELYNGYIIDYSERGRQVLRDTRGKAVLSADRFFFKQDPCFYDTLFVYAKDGYRGYVNLNSGRDEIPSASRHFLKAWFFDNKSSLAAVMDADTRKIGFINPKGEYIIKPQYKYIDGTDYKFKDDRCVLSEENEKFALINSKGETIIDGYDDISNLINGHRILKNNCKKGLWKDSTLVLPVEYDDIILFDSKIELTKDDKCWSTAYDYKTIIDPYIFDNVNDITYQFQSDFSGVATEPQYCDSPKFKNLVICGMGWYEGVFDVQQQKIVVPIEWNNIVALKCGNNDYALFGERGQKYTLLKWD